MRPSGWPIAAIVVAAIAGSIVVESKAVSPPPAALSGVVSSPDEGKMEGVVVTARREGGNIAVSVVSDASGRYSFPRTHLEPGRYTIAIRAVGYDLANARPVDVGAQKAAACDLELRKTADLASQLSSLEWVTSMPGTAEQKDKLMYQAVSCAYCHTLERVLKSKRTASELVTAMTRMQTYYVDGTAVSKDGRGRWQKEVPARVAAAETNPNWGGIPGVPKAELAEYLATVNLSGGRTTWPFELKTLPRPKGRATRVIITQYDMPRKDTVSHDLDLDASGTPWYTDESRMFVGKMDRRTGKFTEYPLPPVPEGDLPGARDIQVDRDGNLWFPRRVAGGAVAVTKFDPKTQEVSTIEGAGGQYMAIGPDGKIWAGWKRIDPKTMKVERTYSWNDSPNLPPGPHGQYVDLTVVDSKGNPWAPDFRGSHIIGIDASTGVARFWPTPTRNSLPRRGRMDAQDHYWFAEYTGDRIGMFDTRAERMHEWPVARRYTTPYAVSSPDRNGDVYATSNTAERLLRLNPSTGDIIEYQIPTDFDSKKIAHDPTTSRVTLWMVNTRAGRLLKVEPLD